MALWGNNDAVGAGGTVILNYATGAVTGAGTSFGNTGAAQEGDVIRFGDRSGTYFGDAVIVSIAGTESCTIGSTMGLSGVAIAGTTFTVSQCPKSSVLNPHYSELNGDFDSYVYGVAQAGAESATTTAFEAGVGWVGVTTYNDGGTGEMRVKKEILVAMSGITTGNAPAYPPTV